MCIATIYIGNDDRKEEAMRDVISVETENGGILLTSIMGEEKLLHARIRSIDFLKHSVIIELEKQQ